MDGRGRWLDNGFNERLRRTVKGEEVYQRAYGSPAEARASLARYFESYNARRPHASLARRTPDQIYY
jgi:putative transposase